MENDDIKCLPDDFVGLSKPSKVIQEMYRNREVAEKNALEHMKQRKKNLCEKYEKLIEEKSEQLKKNLEEIKWIIRNELYESKLRAYNNDAVKLEKASFQTLQTTIHHYTRKRRDLVIEFYNDLLIMEKEKSNEFKIILKNTYEEIKKISFKLPSEYDECIELEIEKINQTILCDHRNYKELKTSLMLEIDNDCKNFIVELKYVKECWKKFLRTQTCRTLSSLKDQHFKLFAQKDPEYLESIEKIKSVSKEIKGNLENVNSVIKLQQANNWLDSIRHTLAKLDYHSQKIISSFKQAAVFVFNRFFQELRVIADQLNEMIEKEEIESIQCDVYTPTLDEIRHLYDVELETIQRCWNDLVDQLSKTVDNTYNFLLIGATLWEKHFKRTEVLEVIILKDVDNTIIFNNSQSEPYETKLNILIDTLRQEPTKERLQKTTEDIKKLLDAMEELYKSQYQIEMNIYKKYKATQEFKIDLLLAEIKRFLHIYPPDLEKDPKIQRKRASWTSEIHAQTEALIPNQMMFCKYQIDAVANWQFGLWEAITNYAVIAKTEILAEIDNWIKTQGSKLEKRLKVRMAIHSFRFGKISAYIYDVRLEELCIHQTRCEEHKYAVESRINALQEQCKNYLDQFEKLFETYDQDLKQLESKCVKLLNSGMVNGQKVILEVKTKKCVKGVEDLSLEYLQKCYRVFETIKASNVRFAESMKLFLEGGNFSIQETKDYLKEQSKIEAQVKKGLVVFQKDIEAEKLKIVGNIEARNDEVFCLLGLVKEEHVFLETMEKKITAATNELKNEVFNFHDELKKLLLQVDQSKTDIIVNRGIYKNFKNFIDNLKDFVKDVEKHGNYLYHSVPIILYSDKSSLREHYFHHAHQSQVRVAHMAHHNQQNGEEFTTRLFNFAIKPEDDNFLRNLNKILFKHWNDIVSYAQGFYTTHQTFYLDESKLDRSLTSFCKAIYAKFLNYQNQCDMKWIEDTRDFHDFLKKFLYFLHYYTGVFVEDYMKKTSKNFETFFDSEMRQPLRKKKDEVKNLYVALHKKLKPLHGHPNNRNLLEKLEIEAKLTEIEAREILDDTNLPSVSLLQERFDYIVEEFITLNTLILQVEEASKFLKVIEEDLFMQLRDKVYLLKTYINVMESDESNTELNEGTLTCWQLFLSNYEKEELRVSLQSFAEGTGVMSPSTTWKSELTDKTVSNKSLLSKTNCQPGVILDVEEGDLFLFELKEVFEKFVNELIETESSIKLVDTLVGEWNFAVKTVLDLYKVKYDHRSN